MLFDETRVRFAQDVFGNVQCDVYPVLDRLEEDEKHLVWWSRQEVHAIRKECANYVHALKEDADFSLALSVLYSQVSSLSSSDPSSTTTDHHPHETTHYPGGEEVDDRTTTTVTSNCNSRNSTQCQYYDDNVRDCVTVPQALRRVESYWEAARGLEWLVLHQHDRTIVDDHKSLVLQMHGETRGDAALVQTQSRQWSRSSRYFAWALAQVDAQQAFETQQQQQQQGHEYDDRITLLSQEPEDNGVFTQGGRSAPPPEGTSLLSLSRSNRSRRRNLHSHHRRPKMMVSRIQQCPSATSR